MIITDRAFHDVIVRSNFEAFLRRCFMTVNPGIPYLPNWHIDAIAHQLHRLRRGEVRRLIINLPRSIFPISALEGYHPRNQGASAPEGKHIIVRRKSPRPPSQPFLIEVVREAGTFQHSRRKLGKR